jgi:hypothetical protein
MTPGPGIADGPHRNGAEGAVSGGVPSDGPSEDTFANLLAGFTLDSGRVNRKNKPEPVEVPEPEPAPAPEPVPAWPAERPVDPFNDTGYRNLVDGDEDAAIVRPYSWTRGRTKSNHDLRLETLVSTSDLGLQQTRLPLEHRAVAHLCRHPHSVAEVAAKLHVPIGVARVLLSDMAERGLVTIHHVVGSDSAAHFGLMERVLSGLRRL